MQVGDDPSPELAVLAVFRRQILQRLPLSIISWPDDVFLQDYSVQQKIFELLRPTPPSSESKTTTRWEKDMWAELGRRIEVAVAKAKEPDIYDSLMETCALFQRLPVMSAADEALQDALITYAASPSGTFNDNVSIKLLEKPRIIAGSGYTGHRTWDAALALSTFMVDSWLPNGTIKDKRILELGAGTGILSFLCAADDRNGAQQVIATDGDLNAMHRLHLNTEYNARIAREDERKLVFGVYKWGTSFEETVIGDAILQAPIDIVLGADITYDPFALPDLVSTLKMLFKQNLDMLCVVAATVRKEETVENFINECNSSGLKVLVIKRPIRPFRQQTCLFHQNPEAVKFLQICLGD